MNDCNREVAAPAAADDAGPDMLFRSDWRNEIGLD